MELSSSACHGLYDLLSCSKMSAIKIFFSQHRNAFSLTEGSPPLQKLDFGLWARVSQRFCFTLSPRSIFHTSQRFPIQKHVTSGFGSLPVTSFPVPVMWLPVPVASKRGHIQTRPLHQNEAKWAIRAYITTATRPFLINNVLALKTELRLWKLMPKKQILFSILVTLKCLHRISTTS